jgi:hypothetical protein
MVDLQTLSVMLASASVMAGVVYYTLQLRHQIKQRQTDLLVRLFSMSLSRDFAEAWEKFAQSETLDFWAYHDKYGFVEVDLVFWFLEQLGRLLQQRLIEIDQLPIPYGQIKVTWEKLKPIMEGARKTWNEPRIAYGV